MSQSPSATRLLGMRVMKVLLWRGQMMQRKKGIRGRKGRKLGPRGKRSIYFIFVSFVSFSSLTTYSRKTWADCQHEDNIDNAKGTPAHLQLCV